MNNSEMKELIRCEFDQILALYDEKSEAYSSDDNALSNFDIQANATGMTVFQIWNVLANKHDIAIINAIKKNKYNPVDSSEGMASRVRDRIVYSLLLMALLDRSDNVEF